MTEREQLVAMLTRANIPYEEYDSDGINIGFPNGPIPGAMTVIEIENSPSIDYKTVCTSEWHFDANGMLLAQGAGVF